MYKYKCPFKKYFPMENGKKTLIKNMHCNIGQYWTFLEFHLPYLGLGRMKQFDKLQKQYHLERLLSFQHKH